MLIDIVSAKGARREAPSVSAEAFPSSSSPFRVVGTKPPMESATRGSVLRADLTSPRPTRHSSLCHRGGGHAGYRSAQAGSSSRPCLPTRKRVLDLRRICAWKSSWSDRSAVACSSFSRINLSCCSNSCPVTPAASQQAQTRQHHHVKIEKLVIMKD